MKHAMTLIDTEYAPQFGEMTAIFGEQRKVLFAKLNDVFTVRPLQRALGVLQFLFNSG